MDETLKLFQKLESWFDENCMAARLCRLIRPFRCTAELKNLLNLHAPLPCTHQTFQHSFFSDQRIKIQLRYGEVL